MITVTVYPPIAPTTQFPANTLDKQRPITMRELDRMIAKARRRHRERAAAEARGWQPKPRRHFR